MRKNIFLLLVFFLFLSESSFAGLLEEKEALLNLIRKNILQLDKKIVEMRNARKINELAELKDKKRKELERAKVLKTEIDKLSKNSNPKKEVQPVNELKEDREVKEIKKEKKDPPVLNEVLEVKSAPKEESKNKFYQIEGGFGGGGLLVKLGYNLPIDNINLVFNGGFGLGSNYSITCLGAESIFPFNDFYIGMRLGLVSYSEPVESIPLVGAVDRGTKIGFGIFSGKDFDLFSAKLGYDSALGLRVELVKNFDIKF